MIWRYPYFWKHPYMDFPLSVSPFGIRGSASNELFPWRQIRIGRRMKWPISGVRRQGRRPQRFKTVFLSDSPVGGGESQRARITVAWIFCRFTAHPACWEHPNISPWNDGILRMSRRHFCRFFLRKWFCQWFYGVNVDTEVGTNLFRKTILVPAR